MDKQFQRWTLLFVMVIIFLVSAYYTGEMISEQGFIISANESWIQPYP